MDAATKADLEIMFSPITNYLTIAFDGGEYTVELANSALRVTIETGVDDKGARPIPLCSTGD